MDSNQRLDEVLKLVEAEAITVNEARAKLGLPPTQGGDVRLIIEKGLVVGYIDSEGNRRTEPVDPFSR